MIDPRAEIAQLNARLRQMEENIESLAQFIGLSGSSSVGHARLHGTDSHIPRHNYSATAAPTASDDKGDGYGVGSLWIDVTNSNSYVCVDATAGAAVWIQTTEVLDVDIKESDVLLGGTAGITVVDVKEDGVLVGSVSSESAQHNALTLAADADALLSLSIQELGLDTQNANVVLAGPATAPAADPTFRALVSADLPATVVETGDADWVDLTDSGETALHSHGGSGMLKTSGGGYFIIPTAPSDGVDFTAIDFAADTYCAWQEAIASTAAALYVVGITVSTPGPNPIINYLAVDIGTGAGGAETSVGEVVLPRIAETTTDTALMGITVMLPFPIPVATTTRIAIRAAHGSVTDADFYVWLICINQADLVDI